MFSNSTVDTYGSYGGYGGGYRGYGGYGGGGYGHRRPNYHYEYQDRIIHYQNLQQTVNYTSICGSSTFCLALLLSRHQRGYNRGYGGHSNGYYSSGIGGLIKKKK